ncbi:hypothetical protein VNO77_18237 [Canavalia gladiata]|uniref:Uncharacterized protein n=1 Tax=Canavalia gladiata TaxID=3824 RepID=A0AAN9QJG0_CANGL
MTGNNLTFVMFFCRLYEYTDVHRNWKLTTQDVHYIAPSHLRFTLTFSTLCYRIFTYLDTVAFADIPNIWGSQRSDLSGLFPCLSSLVYDGAVSEIWDLRLFTCPL